MGTLHEDRTAHPHAGDIVGEGVGGITGVVTGAALGSIGGPLGTLIGGIAGAVGGWWAGREVSHGAAHLTHGVASVAREGRNEFEGHPGINPDGTTNTISTQSPREAQWQSHYGQAGAADRSYDSAQPAYHIGELARSNPEYTGKGFDEIEPVLATGWDSTLRDSHGEWSKNRDFARYAYSDQTSNNLSNGTPSNK